QGRQPERLHATRLELQTVASGGINPSNQHYNDPCAHPRHTHRREQPHKPYTRHAPQNIKHKDPEHRKRSKREDAPPQVTGSPEEIDHAGALWRATTVSPAQTRSPIWTVNDIEGG